jgi:bifunctional non-homologous end joining protein LigD
VAKLKTYRAKRDFGKTSEPRGAARPRKGPGHQYVIQKHAATRLHYDLRLEFGGVMLSWAVTRGPSLVPGDKRLAIHVEDHPIEYNQFEGTIPAGEYGGGTVMIWDYGTYTAAGDAEDPEAALRAGYRKGDFKFVLKGKRLKGSWVLVRTKTRGERSRQGQWLLIKHRDEAADSDTDPTEAYQTSARTGRSMDEIAEGQPKRSSR